jgi:signal transduction histidine kinase
MTENLSSPRIAGTTSHLAPHLMNARTTLPPSPRAPAAARRLVVTLLTLWGLDDLGNRGNLGDLVELAELVVSELVSNAVRHAGSDGDLELELTAGQGRVYLSVADGSPTPPQVLPLDLERIDGRGMRLVDQVATSWGVEDFIFGKRVWVQLSVADEVSATD